MPIYITTGKRNRGPDMWNSQPATTEHFDLERHRDGRGPDRAAFKSPACPTSRSKACGWKTSASSAKAAAPTNRRRIACRRNWATVIRNPATLGRMPAYGVFARHVKDLELANIQFEFQEATDLRPAIVCEDVNGLEIDNFKAPVGRRRPGVRVQRRDRPHSSQFADAGKEISHHHETGFKSVSAT